MKVPTDLLPGLSPDQFLFPGHRGETGLQMCGEALYLSRSHAADRPLTDGKQIACSLAYTSYRPLCV